MRSWSKFHLEMRSNSEIVLTRCEYSISMDKGLRFVNSLANIINKSNIKEWKEFHMLARIGCYCKVIDL